MSFQRVSSKFFTGNIRPYIEEYSMNHERNCDECRGCTCVDFIDWLKSEMEEERRYKEEASLYGVRDNDNDSSSESEPSSLDMVASSDNYVSNSKNIRELGSSSKRHVEFYVENNCQDVKDEEKKLKYIQSIKKLKPVVPGPIKTFIPASLSNEWVKPTSVDPVKLECVKTKWVKKAKTPIFVRSPIKKEKRAQKTNIEMNKKTKISTNIFSILNSDDDQSEVEEEEDAELINITKALIQRMETEQEDEKEKEKNEEGEEVIEDKIDMLPLIPKKVSKEVNEEDQKKYNDMQKVVRDKRHRRRMNSQAKRYADREENAKVKDENSKKITEKEIDFEVRKIYEVVRVDGEIKKKSETYQDGKKNTMICFSFIADKPCFKENCMFAHSFDIFSPVECKNSNECKEFDRCFFLHSGIETKKQLFDRIINKNKKYQASQAPQSSSTHVHTNINQPVHTDRERVFVPIKFRINQWSNSLVTKNIINNLNEVESVIIDKTHPVTSLPSDETPIINRYIVCKMIMQNRPCAFPNCKFAHSLEEFTPMTCRRYNCFFANCLFLHEGETVNDIVTRLGVAFPEPVVSVPVTTPLVRNARTLLPPLQHKPELPDPSITMNPFRVLAPLPASPTSSATPATPTSSAPSATPTSSATLAPPISSAPSATPISSAPLAPTTPTPPVAPLVHSTSISPNRINRQTRVASNVSNTRSRFCKFIKNCNYQNCTFAHTLSELNPIACHFGDRCRRKDSDCFFIHTNETKKDLALRLGFKF